MIRSNRSNTFCGDPTRSLGVTYTLNAKMTSVMRMIAVLK